MKRSGRLRRLTICIRGQGDPGKAQTVWATRSEQIRGPRCLRFAVEIDSRPATYAEVLRGWREDADFRCWFNDLLSEAPFSAFRWENPPLNVSTLARPFEFVLLDSPGLVRPPDSLVFAEHFEDPSGAAVAVFPNLGGDAVMVVPRPITSPSAYAHLAAFVRAAPVLQRHTLWQAVGEALVQRLGREPVWLSTAGAGVSWLHVRLDDRPKYYGFEPYKRSSS